jgi:excisionase family DNA binding protein
MSTTTDTPVLTPEWLPAPAVARVLCVGVRTLLRMVKDGRFIEPVRVGRKIVRWRRCEVYRFLGAPLPDAAQVAVPAPAPPPVAVKPIAPANPLPPPGDLIDVTNAARLLDVSVSLIHRLIGRKKLRSWRIARGPHRLSRAEVLALVEVSGPEGEQAETPAEVPLTSTRFGGPTS